MEKMSFQGEPVLFNKLTIESSLSQSSKKVRIYMNMQKILFSETAGVPLKSPQFYRSLSNENKPNYLPHNSMYLWPITIFTCFSHKWSFHY